MECPNCGAENPEIIADHRYLIAYNEEQGKYLKDDGEVTYSCNQCSELLGIADIQDALREVDEL